MAAVVAGAAPKRAATDVVFTQPCVLHTFEVPAGITSITIEALGASGGQGGGPQAGLEGLGGRVTATIAVTPGEMLQVNVGGFGDFGADVGGQGGCNGGVRGGNAPPTSGRGGGGGGGSSDVRQGGTTFAHRVVVAGGGGGGGGGQLGGAGGSGGGTSGASGANGGGAGGGLGGVGAPVSNAGNPASAGGDGNAGGGGGGGGGDGGDGGSAGTTSGGGGGGGSGFAIASATNVTRASGVRLGNGRVTISYDPPTAVRLRLVSAARSRGGVLLRWQSAQETELLGFNVYRLRGAKLVKLNRSLIPGVFAGTTRGHAYRWLDRGAPPQGRLRYRLQALGLDGKRIWVGSATAR